MNPERPPIPWDAGGRGRNRIPKKQALGVRQEKYWGAERKKACGAEWEKVWGSRQEKAYGTGRKETCGAEWEKV